MVTEEKIAAIRKDIRNVLILIGQSQARIAEIDDELREQGRLLKQLRKEADDE